jgi:hypothetical protein
MDGGRPSIGTVILLSSATAKRKHQIADHPRHQNRDSRQQRLALDCFSAFTPRTKVLTDSCIDPHYADIQHRWRELSTFAGGIIPTRIPLEPSPAEIALVADDLRILARRADALIEAYGDYLQAHSSGVDQTVFRDVLSNALDGNALYEIENASQKLAEDNAESAYYAHFNARAAD